MVSQANPREAARFRSTGNIAGSDPTDDRKVNLAISSRKALFPTHHLQEEAVFSRKIAADDVGAAFRDHDRCGIGVG